MEKPDEGTKSKIRVRVKRRTSGSPPRSGPPARSSPRLHASTSSPEIETAAAASPDTDRKATVIRLFKTLPHVNARSEYHPEYRGKRKKVEDEQVAWSVPWDDYDRDCPELTAKVVFENGRQLYTGDKWADPPNAQELRAELESRLTYENGGKIFFGGDGRPLNPRGRTGLRGRGLFGQWGPNHAADPIVTRLEPLTGTMQVRTKGVGFRARVRTRLGSASRCLLYGHFLTRVGCRHGRCWPSSARALESGPCRAAWSRLENRSRQRR